MPAHRAPFPSLAGAHTLQRSGMDWLLEKLDTHWPLAAVALILAVFGRFASKHVFTKKRAMKNAAWDFCKDTMPLHPIAAGAGLGLALPDPLGAGWAPYLSCLYFAAGGVGSLFFWIFWEWYAKKRGIPSYFPGESLPP